MSEKFGEDRSAPQMQTQFSEVHEIHARSGRTIKTHLGVNILLLGTQDGLSPLLARVGIYQTVAEEVRPIYVISSKAARELAQDLLKFADHADAAEAARERHTGDS